MFSFKFQIFGFGTFGKGGGEGDQLEKLLRSERVQVQKSYIIILYEFDRSIRRQELDFSPQGKPSKEKPGNILVFYQLGFPPHPFSEDW